MIQISLNVFLKVEVSAEKIAFFRKKSREKIERERWTGRNADLKALNFQKAWTSEFAWKNLLDERQLLYEWADTYVGTVTEAPLDFRMWFNGKEKTIGIRSRDISELRRWKQVPYPDDRVRTMEYDRIEDYTIVAGIHFRETGEAMVKLFGAIPKQEFIQVLNKTNRKPSPDQQEYFRPVDLRHFNYSLMLRLLESADKA